MSASPPPQPTASDSSGDVLAQLDPTQKASITEADGAPPAPTVQAKIRRANLGSLPMALLRRFLDA